MKQLLSFSIPGPSGTQRINAPTNIPDGGELTLGGLLGFGISFLFGIALILSLIFLLLGGFTWITSGGDPEKIDKARKTLIYAVVGLVLVTLSYAIINIVLTMIGAQGMLFGF